MDWASALKGFKVYLRLEKSLSGNTLDAYYHDVELLNKFLEEKQYNITPENIKLSNLQEFLAWIGDMSIGPRSQARLISGIRAFYKYLLMEDEIQQSPAELLELPKLPQKLPEVLSIEEIDMLIDAIDLSKPDGQRNKAILGTLYSCGLRVSELVELKITEVSFDEGYLRVIGKGNKQRIVPLGKTAAKYLRIYIDEVRCHIAVQKGAEDTVFLNKSGKKLTTNCC